MRFIVTFLTVLCFYPQMSLGESTLELHSQNIIHGRLITCTHWDQSGECDEAIDHQKIGFYDPDINYVVGSTSFDNHAVWCPRNSDTVPADCSFLPTDTIIQDTIVPYDSPLVTSYATDQITYFVVQSLGIKDLTIYTGGLHETIIYSSESDLTPPTECVSSVVQEQTPHNFYVRSDYQSVVKVDLTYFECENWTSIEMIGSNRDDTFIGSSCDDYMFGGFYDWDQDLMIGNGGKDTILDYGGYQTWVEGGGDDDKIEVKYVYEWFVEGNNGCDTIDITPGTYVYGGESWGGYEYSEGESCDVVACGCGLSDCTYGTHYNCFSWNLAPCDTSCN